MERIEKPNIKKCTGCNVDFPASSEYFRKVVRGKYGYGAKCKSCLKLDRKKYTSNPKYKKKHAEKMSEWRKKNPDKALEISRKNYKKNGWKQNERKKEKLRTCEEYKKKVRLREKRYTESGRRSEMNRKPETLEKARIRNTERRKDHTKKQHDYKVSENWRNENREHLRELHEKSRKCLSDSYVAKSMRISVKDVPNHILEVHRMVIKLKRELKIKNVKIR